MDIEIHKVKNILNSNPNPTNKKKKNSKQKFREIYTDISTLLKINRILKQQQ